MFRKRCLMALVLALPAVAFAETRCEQTLKKWGGQLADVNCFESTDLTTNNPLTTPADNSLPGLPPFAFTPRLDRAVLVNTLVTPPVTTPIVKAVPGVQINARIASDPTGQARFLLRLPDDWNGKLVVAGTPSQRSEFSSDFAWSDYVVQKGYAFASQNKGMLNAYFTTPSDPLGCRTSTTPVAYVHYYADEPDKPYTRWTKYMILAAQLAREGVKGAYGKWPRRTYAVGTSNGGYQVRRAVEAAPELFDGGVDWEGTFAQEPAPNVLTDLPPAILNFPDYVLSGYNSSSLPAKNIMAAGYPPDIANPANATDTLWGRNYVSYWGLTVCQWQKRLDPAYDTYGSGLETYNYVQRLSFSDVGLNMAEIATTGLIQRPLITLQGTMDGLLPLDHHGRAYERAVKAGYAVRPGADPHRPAYRLYEIQNGNHIEFYKTFFPQLEYILFHAQRAFDLIVAHVEDGAALPPDQCVPRGGAISPSPSQPGHCTNLLAP